MQVHILTLFPEMFAGPFDHSIMKRAIERGLVNIHLTNIRDYSHDRHRTVDDSPYGGGPGMVMKPEPLFEAVESILAHKSPEVRQDTPVVLMTPQGQLFTQAMAQELSSRREMIIICGHYQGVDERVCQQLVAKQISIGDYVLTGGELAAMVVVDAVVRLLPGVVGSEDSVAVDSFTSGLLQYPLYTRPPVFRDWAVPDVLVSGDHSAIAQWRRRQALLRTQARRPDLLAEARLPPEERHFLEQVRKEATGDQNV